MSSSSKRVRATSLILLNWRGVFFREYELDRHVTALEGANGAGKTTAMIAAYVVLLPDMTRLRFTNLGESAATAGDRGIWGRLGEPGRPSYAAMAFQISSRKRLIAGVHLDRKGEPTVEPTPFLIHDPPTDVSAQRLFLTRSEDGLEEFIPTLGELRDRVALEGARLEIFSNAKDYFASLFSFGVLPLRLKSSNDRDKFNEMLKTSMTGGMSRGLLSELRAFLLEEKRGLSQSLRTMNENLIACRGTRAEVRDSRALEQESSQVYRFGEEMFLNAVAATCRSAREGAHNIEQAHFRQEQLRAERATAEEDFERADRRSREANAALEHANEEHDRLVALVAVTKQAANLYINLLDQQKLAQDLEQQLAEHKTLLEQRTRASTAATTSREVATRNFDAARQGRDDWQRGLEELIKRAAFYNKAREARAHVMKTCGELGVELDLTSREEVILGVERMGIALEEADAKRRSIRRELNDASAHEREYTAAKEALDLILDECSEEMLSELLAREALARHEARRENLANASSLESSYKELTHALQRRREALERFSSLDLQMPSEVERLTLLLMSSLEEAQRNEREATARVGALERTQSTLETELSALANEERELRLSLEQYTRYQRRRASLEEALNTPITTIESLLAVRNAIAREITVSSEQISNESRMAGEHGDAARALVHRQGGASRELLALQEELAGELFSSRFDDVALEDAAALEARWAPLADAIIVEDLEHATRVVKERVGALPTVRLIEDASNIDFEPPETHGGCDVIVDDEMGRRITRLPEKPTFGRSAREARADEHFARERELLASIDEHQRALEELSRQEQVCEGLITHASCWLREDPARRLEVIVMRTSEIREELTTSASELDELAARVRELSSHVQTLLTLLPETELLCRHTLGEEIEAVEERIANLERDRAYIARVGEAPTRLAAHKHALAQSPLSAKQRDDLGCELAVLDTHRDHLDKLREALVELERLFDSLADEGVEATLRDERDIAPKLEQAYTHAEAELRRAQRHEQDCVEQKNAAAVQVMAADQRLENVRQEIEKSSEVLESFNVGTPDKRDIEVLDENISEAKLARENARRALSDANTEFGSASERWSDFEERFNSSVQETQVIEANEQPRIDTWRLLEEQLAAAEFLETIRSSQMFDSLLTRSSHTLYESAGYARDKLLLQLGNTRGGEELIGVLGSREGSEVLERGAFYLSRWIEVRSWLMRRWPTDIVQDDDPLLALERMRDKLQRLEEKLAMQEDRLRLDRENIAGSIEQDKKAASRRVRKLSRTLEQISFGSIASIRIKLTPDERMGNVLRALREPEVQQALFRQDMPLEEALDEILRRYGGSGTRDRVLDYREYVQLVVQIQRVGALHWEDANPTRLSTGEAIGVGAALMMVVLTEWESNSRMFNREHKNQSLRLLFLDEANRLDHSNLATLFSLCTSLDLQLIAAAPEVAHGEHCTAYTLVRTQDKQGREIVEVTGRKLSNSQPKDEARVE